MTAKPQAYLAADGGISYSLHDGRDPYEVLDDLMTVVEALSPKWPPRETRIVGNCFRL